MFMIPAPALTSRAVLKNDSQTRIEVYHQSPLWFAQGSLREPEYAGIHLTPLPKLKRATRRPRVRRNTPTSQTVTTIIIRSPLEPTCESRRMENRDAYPANKDGHPLERPSTRTLPQNQRNHHYSRGCHGSASCDRRLPPLAWYA